MTEPDLQWQTNTKGNRVPLDFRKLSDAEQLQWMTYYCHEHTGSRKSASVHQMLWRWKTSWEDHKARMTVQFRAVYYFYWYTHWAALANDERRQLQASLRICAEQKESAERELEECKAELQALRQKIQSSSEAVASDVPSSTVYPASSEADPYPSNDIYACLDTSTDSE